jgi:hypothetical protein
MLNREIRRNQLLYGAWPGYNWMAEKTTITGLVERTDDGLAIRSGGSEYMLAGKDLSDFVGKKAISGSSVRTCNLC